MTQPARARLAAPVLVIYWLMVLGGLTLFTVTHADDVVPTIAPLWLGAVAGTLLGQYLALHDFRFWIVALTLLVAAMYGGPLLPSGPGSMELWQAFIPAALCGFWSLSDRAVLAAAWFPLVLWMLTILDHSEAQLAPDGAAAVLLGGIVVLLVALLRARESRRVALWRSVAALPLAPARPVECLREPPGRQLARAAWGLSIGAITIALAVWLAPPLWQTEDLGGDPIELAGAQGEGLPCCPLYRLADTESSRVREYLDLGLGHDERAASPSGGLDCRACSEPATAAWVPGIDTVTGRADVAVAPLPSGPGVDVEPAAPGAAAWTRAGSPSEPIDPMPAQEPAVPTRPTTDRGSPIETTLIGEPPRAVPEPRELPSQASEDTPQEPPRPPPAAAPIPPPLPAAAPASTPPPQTAVARPALPHRTAAHATGPSLLRWLALLAIAALVLQLVRIALRPLRRLITLRHLRRPFWDETIDQRVSNAWQLTLIGLGDAGWRAGAAEAPQQLARRTGIDGVDRCATILERARHGVGIDAGDLADMQAAADVAYRAARTGLPGFARAVSWLRWPLT